MKKYAQACNQYQQMTYAYESGHVEEILKKIYEKRRGKIMEGKRQNDYRDLTEVLIQSVNNLHRLYTMGQNT